MVTVKAPPGGVSALAGVAGISTTDNGTVTLNAGDVIEIFSDGGPSISDPNDLSGTLITSTAPIQVIGGHQCTNVPDALGYCDHIEESMFPVETLSTSYIVTAPLILPTIGSGIPEGRDGADHGDQAQHHPHLRSATGGAPALIAKAGQWVEIANTAADFMITGSNPILVTQYMEGAGRWRWFW